MADASTVALLFTDLVDSTALHERLGDEGVDDLRRRHFQLLADAIGERGGREVKRLGDGVMAAFTSAGDAVSAAVAIQKAVAGMAADGAPVAVRVGVNAGEVTAEEGDYYGSAVNVAARLCQAAGGGEIVASDVVRALVGNRGGHRFARLGNLELKGIAEPVAAWSVEWRDADPEPAGEAEPREGEAPIRVSLPLPHGLDPQSAANFVGRGEDVASLTSLWREAADGQARLVLVAGEPGIGKTRLSSEFARGAHAEGALILYGKAEEEGIPYQPFVEAIGEMLAKAEPAAARSALLADVGPELTRIVPDLGRSAPPASVAADPETERYRLFESVAVLFAALAKAGPVVLVIDDLHWADKPSLLMLRHLLRSPRARGLLILGTYRETDLDRRHPLSEALGDLRRDPGYDRILLRGLSADEVREYMETAAGHAFSGRGLEVPKAIHRETEGNPFFITEVVRHMVDTGVFVQRDGVWVYNASSVADLGLPEGIRDVVSRRLARLSDGTNQVLAQASVLGREFDFDVLALMAGDSDTALAAVEEAMERGLLSENRDRRAVSYAFTHALVRQTLYDEMTMPRRQKLHLRAAEAIEQAHGKNVDAHVAVLALHYRTAGAAADAERTIDYSIRAGRAAYATAAFEEAIVHLEAALQLIDEEDVGRDRETQVLEYLGDLMHVTGLDREKGIRYLERALTINERENRLDRVVQVRSRLGRAYSSYPTTMNIPLALEHYRAAEAMIAGLPEIVPIGYLQLGIAGANLYNLRIEDATVAAERAMRIATENDSQALWIQAAAMRGWLMGERGQLAEGWTLVEDAWARADRIGHVVGAFFCTWILSGLWFYAGGYAASMTVNERELAKGRMDQVPEQKGLLLAQVMANHLGAGDTETGREIGEDPILPVPNLTSVYLRLIDGGWEDGLEQLRAGWADWRARGMLVFAFSPGWLFTLAHAQRVTGDIEGERATLQEMLDLCQNNGTTTGLSRVVWYSAPRLIADGRIEEVVANLAELRGRIKLEEWGGLEPRLELVDAEIALARGDVDAAMALSAAALPRLAEHPEPMTNAEAWLTFGQALRRHGMAEEAARHFDEAEAIYRQYGYSQRWIDRVDAIRAES